MQNQSHISGRILIAVILFTFCQNAKARHAIPIQILSLLPSVEEPARTVEDKELEIKKELRNQLAVANKNPGTDPEQLPPQGNFRGLCVGAEFDSIPTPEPTKPFGGESVEKKGRWRKFTMDAFFGHEQLSLHTKPDGEVVFEPILSMTVNGKTVAGEKKFPITFSKEREGWSAKKEEATDRVKSENLFDVRYGKTSKESGSKDFLSTSLILNRRFLNKDGTSLGEQRIEEYCLFNRKP